MSWPDTTGSTRATGHSSVRNVTGPFPGQTTSPCTWRDIYETEPWNEGRIWKKKEKENENRKKEKNKKQTLNCLQAVEQRDKLWCSRQKKKKEENKQKKKKQSITYSLKSLSVPLEADPVFAHCTGDSTRPLSQGCKLLLKGTNWNLSYLTDKTWRTRCQPLFFFSFFFFCKLEMYFLSGKPGATDKNDSGSLLPAKHANTLLKKDKLY